MQTATTDVMHATFAEPCTSRTLHTYLSTVCEAPPCDCVSSLAGQASLGVCDRMLSWLLGGAHDACLLACPFLLQSGVDTDSHFPFMPRCRQLHNVLLYPTGSPGATGGLRPEGSRSASASPTRLTGQPMPSGPATTSSMPDFSRRASLCLLGA